MIEPASICVVKKLEYPNRLLSGIGTAVVHPSPVLRTRFARAVHPKHAILLMENAQALKISPVIPQRSVVSAAAKVQRSLISIRSSPVAYPAANRYGKAAADRMRSTSSVLSAMVRPECVKLELAGLSFRDVLPMLTTNLRPSSKSPCTRAQSAMSHWPQQFPRTLQ